jgi:uncharacterized membrane protein
MRKVCILLLVVFVVMSITPTAYCFLKKTKDINQQIQEAKAEFKKVRKAYVLAKEELSDAQIESVFTLGKAEKQEAVERVQKAREEARAAKKAYKEALSKLHDAEVARDAKIDRSPWN